MVVVWILTGTLFFRSKEKIRLSIISTLLREAKEIVAIQSNPKCILIGFSFNTIHRNRSRYLLDFRIRLQLTRSLQLIIRQLSRKRIELWASNHSFPQIAKDLALNSTTTTTIYLLLLSCSLIITQPMTASRISRAAN